MSGKDVGVIALFMLCCAFGGFGLGLSVGKMWTRNEAAEQHAGRWVVEEKTGKPSWEWTGRTP